MRMGCWVMEKVVCSEGEGAIALLLYSFWSWRLYFITSFYLKKKKKLELGSCQDYDHFAADFCIQNEFGFDMWCNLQLIEGCITHVQ